jgi:multicomponent Na+:H+ antiporter subunit E
MISKITLFILWLTVWILLTWPPEVGDIVTGVFVSLVICFMTLDTLKESYDRDYAPALKREGVAANLLRPFWFLWYVIVFVWECFKANIDVAYRVIHPDLPIRPGTLRVKVALKSDIGLTFLANSITLTPGTTSVDVDKDMGYLYVHMLYVKEDSGRLAIVEKFENIIRRIFE